MAERRPVYSAQATRQQIGYIEDDEAFDLLDRPCAIYNGDTGLLRDPKLNVVVGYVSLANIFVGSARMGQELFLKPGPVPPSASSEDLDDKHSDAPVYGAEDGHAKDAHAERFIAPASPLHDTVKTDLSVVSTPTLSEQTSGEENGFNATDIPALASSSQQDKLVALAFLSPTGQRLGDSSSEQTARPQDSSEKGSARDGPGSDYASRTEGETAPAQQPDEDAGTLTLAPSDESAFACAQPEEPPRRDGMPPAVDAFMRHLAEYVHSNNNQYATLPSSSCTSRTISEAAPALHADVDAYTLMLAPCDESTVESAQADEPSGEVGMPPAVQWQNHQTTVQSSSAEDAGELKLSVSAEAQKDADRVRFSGEPYSQGESSDCGGRSGLARVDPEQTEYGVSVSMESPVEIARDAHQEHNSNTTGGAETNNATPGIVLTEMDLSAERPSVDTDIAEPVASVDRFAPLFGDHAGFHARVTRQAVPDSDRRLSADTCEVMGSLATATPDHQQRNAARDRMVIRSADGLPETAKQTLSGAYYRHRAEVLRFALITARSRGAAGRLRTFIEKYRALADRAAP